MFSSNMTSEKIRRSGRNCDLFREVCLLRKTSASATDIENLNNRKF